MVRRRGVRREIDRAMAFGAEICVMETELRAGGRSRAWVLPLLLIAFSAVVVPVRMFEPDGLPRYRALRQELRRAQADNGVLRTKVHKLFDDVTRLKHDRATLRRVAREELGLVLPGEYVTHIP